ncbi:MAG: M56 family metallopeptidase, partial [Acidobacteriota bacterium]
LAPTASATLGGIGATAAGSAVLASTPGEALSGTAAPVAAALPWQAWLLAGWGLGALVALALLSTAWRFLLHRLSGRRTVTDGTALALLSEIRSASGFRRSVRLSVAEGVTVPLAFGVRRPEICLPPRALDDLDSAEMRGLLGHELAHHVRRDPLRQLALAFASATLWPQPLHRLAVARIREACEHLADDMARTWADGRSVARCLAAVAEWVTSPRTEPVPGMAVGRSGLGRRVHRLLSPAAARGPSVPRSIAFTLFAAVCLVTATVAPSWTAGAHPAPPSTPTPAAVLPSPAPSILTSASPAPPSPMPVPHPAPAVAPPTVPQPPTPHDPPVPAPEPSAPLALQPAMPEPPEPAPAPRPVAAPTPAPAQAPPAPVNPEPVIPEPVIPEPAIPAPPVAPEPPAETGIEPPRLLRYGAVDHAFPPKALQFHRREAEVETVIEVGADGKVRRVEVLSDRDRYGFARTAEEALLGATFEPARVDGEPVTTSVTFTVGFRAPPEPPATWDGGGVFRNPPAWPDRRN